MTFAERLRSIKLLVLDHDGVLTDNQVYVNERGEEMCRYSRADGMGIERLKKLGVEVIVLSGETGGIVEARCRKLELTCFAGITDKLGALKEWCYGAHLLPEQVAYVGNDLNDLECLLAVGLPIIVQDAEASLKIALSGKYQTTVRTGGEGAVREVCDAIADAKEAQGPLVYADTGELGPESHVTDYSA